MRKTGMAASSQQTQRPPETLLPSLGKPAEFSHRIVERRVRILSQIPDFIGKGYSLVDVGCGNGASSFLLAERMKECVGIDVGEDNERVYEERKSALGITNCRFLRRDIERDRIEGGFDRLISFEVIEHLRHEQSVRRFADLLKPGGIAAISVPNKWWLFETHGARLPFLAWNRVPFFSWLPRPVHERFAKARIYTKRRISQLLISAGFRTLQMSYITAPMDVLPEGWLKRVLTETVFRGDTVPIPFLATSIFVVAEKSLAGKRV
jgi:2-polyprenyl-3-methyl-5-hydroxy-6-metoxy-1,4-benzoquinol methylase